MRNISKVVRIFWLLGSHVPIIESQAWVPAVTACDGFLLRATPEELKDEAHLPSLLSVETMMQLAYGHGQPEVTKSL